MGASRSDLKLLSRLLGEAFVFKKLLLGVIVAAFGTVAAGVAETYLLKTIIDQSTAGQLNGLVGYLFLLLAVLTIGATATYFRFKLSGYFSGCFVHRLNQRLFAKVTSISVAELDKYDAGDMVARFSSDIRKINTFAEVSLPLLILHPVMFVMGAVYLGVLDLQLLLLSMIPIPVGFLLIMLMTRSMSQLSLNTQTYFGRGFAVLAEMLAGFSTMKVFQLRGFLYQAFQQQMDTGLSSQLRLVERYAWMGPVQVMIRLVPSIVCLIVGGNRALSGDFSLGELIAFFYLLNFVIDPVAQLPAHIAGCKDALGAGKRIFQVLDEKDEQFDNIRLRQGDQSALVLEDVGLVYQPSHAQSVTALRDIALTLRPGEKVAIVGESGSGKSSLLNVLCGFYPHTGAIHLTVNENETQGPLGEAYRARLSVVNQSTFLFPVSILDNIRLARPDATELEVIHAAQKAYADNFIRELPQGYQTVLGDDGNALSYGQKQRISLARAFLKSSPILMMDEPTASLDATSESLVEQAILQEADDRTVILITHKLAITPEMDRIVVLDQGNVVENGSYHDLMAKRGAFYQLHQAYFQHTAQKELSHA
ncbi:ABC transporter ATP-binding protein [Photobacterium sp. TY1-4]|uniref:ABC transporter ATP-binding protein n=1 Tax=Photobacterium sp. TY1-4 TaxID=2899122 RepID=UPI0021C201E8|nr:ABC transporter ATP-binding protein [Photobacterium sp. TY1-4]UXI00907.1 ABC transporter ATP-binding protein/permease [Photobacterium sp. TY1-4]